MAFGNSTGSRNKLTVVANITEVYYTCIVKHGTRKLIRRRESTNIHSVMRVRADWVMAETMQSLTRQIEGNPASRIL